MPSKKTQPREKMLPYPRDHVAQDTFYNCGPASTQTVILSATGRLVSEYHLGREMGTSMNGTDDISLIAPVLTRHIKGATYRVARMPNDPPTADQKRRMVSNMRSSISKGYGVVANIVAPPSNYPRAVKPSTISPRYAGGTVYHYIAVMGYAPGRFWVADSGFYPYGYWISEAQLASLIPPKGYAYAV